MLMMNRLSDSRAQSRLGRAGLALCLSALAWGCAAGAATDETADLTKGDTPAGSIREKDLAIILPLESSAPVRATDRNTAGERYLPAAWYQAVLSSYRPTLVGDALEIENRESDWMIVSARVSPCSAFGRRPTAQSTVLCWPELRLVWQPVVRDVTVGGIHSDFYGDDRAIHALYDIQPDTALTAAEAQRARGYLGILRQGQPLSAEAQSDFVALRNRVTQSYLADVLALRGNLPDSEYAGHGLRPEIFSEADEESFRDRLGDLLDRHARPASLKALTSFSLPEGRQPAHLDDWIFLAFRGQNGTIVPADITIHAASDGRELINLGHAERASMTRDDDRLYEQLAPADQAELAQSVLLFINERDRLLPLLRDRRQLTVPNTSCASCHKLNRERFDFHNLSYLEDRAVTISPRVVTDVALDLEWLAQNQPSPGPGQDTPPPDTDEPGDEPAPQRYFESTQDVAIPDNNATGATSSLEVALAGEVTRVAVEVDIDHTYIGDLTVTLIAPDSRSYVLHNRQGGSTDNLRLQTTVTLPATRAAGTWRLTVQDRARLDTGFINRWALSL